MKKLLARRKKEEEEQKEEEKVEEVIQEAEPSTTDAEHDLPQKVQELDAELIEELKPAAPAPKSEEAESHVTYIGGREQPSLRVGRTRTSRNHIVRPKVRAQAGRFSAFYNEDEDEIMEEGGQKEIKTTGTTPAGFTFATMVCQPCCMNSISLCLS